MKNLLWIAATMLSMVIGMTACSEENDNRAEAQIPYQAVCDNIVFSDSADNEYEDCIVKILESEEIALTGTYSLFIEKATVDDRYIENAIAKCNSQAIETYSNKLKTVSSDRLRAALEATYGDSISFEDLDRFQINYSLYGFINGNEVKVSTYNWEY